MAQGSIGSYFHTFLQPQNVAMQKRFFDRYLKGADNGWENEPPVEVEIRARGDTVKRGRAQHRMASSGDAVDPALS
jgi:hypothetical protein